MIDFSGKRVSVIGLGISNIPLISWLLERGAVITARDKKPLNTLSKELQKLSSRVTFVCGDEYLENINEEIIFKTPGLRYDLPQLTRAVEAGATLTSEMELFFELCPCKIIGITGSDGKTTTTTLIYKCLSEQYGEDKVFVGGNIGKPLLPRLPEMTEDSFAVVELSSFQLHTMKHSPDISIITNLSPNHLDYHRGMEEYIEAKKNIYLHARRGSILVLNGVNSVTKELGGDAPEGVEIRYFLSGNAEVNDGYIEYGGKKVLNTEDILIPGRHNIENYCGVVCALHGLVSDEVIKKVAKTFGGVEHRIELVREKDGVKYYNSSIDSSPTRTAAALNSFKQKLIVILGGYDKNIPFEPLAEPLCRMAKTVVLTGATAEKIKAAIISYEGYREGSPKILQNSNFKEAVLMACGEAKSGDILLLSPACASFDAFKNFEERGNTFKEIIRGL